MPSDPASRSSDPNTSRSTNPYGSHQQLQFPSRPPSRQHNSQDYATPHRNPPHNNNRQPPQQSIYGNPGAHGYVSTRGLEPGVHGDYVSSRELQAARPQGSRPPSRGLWTGEGHRDSQRSRLHNNNNAQGDHPNGLSWLNDNYTASNA